MLNGQAHGECGMAAQASHNSYRKTHKCSARLQQRPCYTNGG
jgi:hypothetical protein